MRHSSGSKDRTRHSRCIEIASTGSGPSGTIPPEYPVAPPTGTIGVSLAYAHATSCRACSASAGRASTAATPRSPLASVSSSSRATYSSPTIRAAAAAIAATGRSRTFSTIFIKIGRPSRSGNDDP
jgi:hypothetical protein